LTIRKGEYTPDLIKFKHKTCIKFMWI